MGLGILINCIRGAAIKRRIYVFPDVLQYVDDMDIVSIWRGDDCCMGIEIGVVIIAPHSLPPEEMVQLDEALYHHLML